MGGLARGPPQDPTIWPRLDLGDHAPHEQDDLTGAAPGSCGGRGELQKEVESEGNQEVSQGRGLSGKRGKVVKGKKPLMSGQKAAKRPRKAETEQGSLKSTLTGRD